MLRRLLKSLVGAGQSTIAAPDEEDRSARVERAHERAPMDRHLQILFDHLRVGEERLPELVERCMSESRSTSPASKALHKPLAFYFLAQYFLHSLGIEGERAECGVFQGSSALLLCHAARTRDPSYAGARLHLIDSFAGLSAPQREDRFSVTTGGTVKRASAPAGAYAAPIEAARGALRAFSQVTFHHGWIPDAFASLPEAQWSFVHIDVDLHEPTYASLDYFFPRLARGGVIICDDYGAPLFPGAHRAWDRYCEEHDVPYVVLDTGQSVILKT